MKNRALKVLAVGLALAGLVAGALPAQAATLSWDDEAGDATDAGVGAAVLPNDAAFDVTKVELTTAGDKLVWTVDVPDLTEGQPTFSTGYYFRLAFTHDGVTYWFIVGEDVTGAKTFSVGPTATGTDRFECKDCKGEINRERKAVVVEAPLASLDAGFATAQAPPTAGATWDSLYVLAQRRMVAATLTADRSDAPDGASFSF